MTSGVILTSVSSRRRCLITSCPAVCGIRWVKPSMATVSPSWTFAAIASASDTISAIPHQPPQGGNRSDSDRGYRNDIDRALSEQLCGLRKTTQDLRSHGERTVGRWDTRVDGDLQQDLADLVGSQAVAQRGSGMHGKFFVLSQRGEGGQGDHASLGPGQAGPVPDLAPGVARNEVLERGCEVGRVGDGSVDVLVSQNLAARLHTFCHKTRLGATDLDSFVSRKGSGDELLSRAQV